jgi:hypothetical protein
MQTARSPWTPEGFEEYRRVFPRSPELTGGPGDRTDQFRAAWRRVNDGALAGLRAQAAGLTAVFVRGLFGRWIPRHFVAPFRLLRHLGVDSIIARSHASGTIETNAGLIQRDVSARVPSDRRLLFLCHSKGGLDVLAMLQACAPLRERTKAIVLCQTPRSGCAILERVLYAQHQESSTRIDRFKERIANAALGVLDAKAACAQLTGAVIQDRLAGFDKIVHDVRTISVASWSREPTAWLDSQHERLGRIRPGCAHDGLFYTEDLIWSASHQLLLPCIDHSQPSVGGQGFAHDGFWLALTSMALDS